jgi:phosphoribosylformylglycinamidine synthase
MAGFVAEGDAVLLLGAGALEGDAASLAGSEYLAHVHGQVIGKPGIDLDAEARLQSLLIALASDALLRSAHDCSDGGLAVAVAESAVLGGIGLVGDPDVMAPGRDGRWDAALFGEAPSRVVASCAGPQAEEVVQAARTLGVPVLRLGTVGGERFTFAGLVDEPLDALADAFDNGLDRALV